MRLEIERSEQYIVALFSDEQIAVISINSGLIVKKIPNMAHPYVFVDEFCSTVVVLDDRERAFDLYFFDWVHKIKKIDKPIVR